MSEVTKFYIKVFLIFGVVFALGTILVDFVLGDPINLYKSLFQVLFFGGFMTIVLVPGQINTLRKLGVTEFTPDTLSVTQKRIILSSLSQEELVDRIQQNSHLSKMKMRISNNEIHLISRFSWHLWGEIVKICIRTLEGGENEFDIVSRPRQRFNLLDGGQNYKHVTVLEEVIRSYSS